MRVPRNAPVLLMMALVLVISLGGAGYAGSKIGANGLKNNAVTTPKIKNNAVKTSKIKNNAIKTPKIKNNAVTADKVRDNTLTGADIAEETLVAAGGAVSLSGLQFHPRDSTLTYAYGFGGSIYRTGGNGYFTAPLDLPQGATITDLTVHVVDNDPGNGVSVFLSRYEPATATLDDLALSDSIDTPGVQPVSLNPAEPVVVDNTRFAYTLLVALGADSPATRLVGAQVAYGPSSPSTPLPRSSRRGMGGNSSDE